MAAQVLRNLGLKLEEVREEVLNMLGASSEGSESPGADGGTAFERFTDRAQKVMALANQEAQRFNHEYIGTEHILLGLVKGGSGVGANVLKNLHVNLRSIPREVEKLIKAGPEMATMGKLPQTPRAKKVIEYAIEESKNLGHNCLGTEHLLLGLLREHDGVAAQALRNLGLKLDEVREEARTLHGAAAPSPMAPPRPDCPLCTRLAIIHTDPSLIAALHETYALLADNQGPRGWCTLVFKSHAEHLADLDAGRQLGIFRDVAAVAAAIRAVFPDTGMDGGPPRINYECLGNLVPHIHWHVIPRHADDPDPTRTVRTWPQNKLRGTMDPTERGSLIGHLRRYLRA